MELICVVPDAQTSVVTGVTETGVIATVTNDHKSLVQCDLDGSLQGAGQGVLIDAEEGVLNNSEVKKKDSHFEIIWSIFHCNKHLRLNWHKRSIMFRFSASFIKSSTRDFVLVSLPASQFFYEPL